jgi:transposase InsO family protein
MSIANIVEVNWLTRYPLPTQVIIDRGNEFMGHEFKTMMSTDYGIKVKPTKVRNPQANAILERVHQTLGNIIRTFELQDKYLDEEDPWAGILSAAAFALRSTYHTTLQASPGQLVFGRDMMLNKKHKANKMEQPYEGPYKILQVNTNGTVRLKMGPVLDTVNIRRLQPYKSPMSDCGGECNMRRSKQLRTM